MQWFSFVSGMTAGTFIGTVVSALCHAAAQQMRKATAKDLQNEGMLDPITTVTEL